MSSSSRWRRPALFLTAAALVAVLNPFTPARAATVNEIYFVPTVGGAEIRVEVQRDSAKTNQPVILTVSPYNTYGDALQQGQPARDSEAARYVPKGYARAVADLLGTRGSTGCWDYGGRNEVQAALDTVMFLAKLPWSNGRVAMMGASYDGTIANGVASLGDKVRDEQGRGLHAIVPIVAISRWYGYGYSQGMRYTLQSTDGDPSSQGIDTPLVFDFRSGRTVAPPAGTDAQRFAANVAARAGECGAVAHTSAGYDESPDYDAFWDERDYLAKAAAFRVPVFVGGAWQDYNVKMDESVNLFNALPMDDPKTLDEVEGVPFKRMVMQQMGHGVPSICSWSTDLDNFLDHYLLGKPLKSANLTKNGQVCSQGRVGSGSGHINGAALTAAWPPPGTTDVTLSLSRTGTSGAISTAPAAGGPATFRDGGAGDEVAALRDPARQDTWLWYTSPPLAADTRMAGEARLNAAVSVAGTRGTVTPVLVDLGPDGTRIAARGFLDLRYRSSLRTQAPIAAGAPLTGTVVMKPQDYTFKGGTRIGVLLLASNTMWVRPDVPGQTTTVLHGATGPATTLTLPLVNPAAPLFAAS